MDIIDYIGLMIFIVVIILVAIFLVVVLFNPILPDPNLCFGNSSCPSGQSCRGDHLCYPGGAGGAAGAACSTNGDCQLNLICLNPETGSRTCGTIS